MSETTEADREKAASLLAAWHGGNFGQGVTALEPLIAFALAEEREKARAPFLDALDLYDAGHLWSSEVVPLIRRAAEASA